jgi:ribosomal 50S subunit-recycling heat shock protein
VPDFFVSREEKAMRIDKFLKVSRLIKRRTVANEACDQGRITANGKVVKASYDVKEGDVLEIKMGERILKIRVREVAEHVLKGDASGLYEVID